MKISTAASLIASGQSSHMMKLLRMSNEFYRASYISAAIYQGVYGAFENGRTTPARLAERLGGITNLDGLRAWLDLGVSVGELKRSGEEYRIAGKLSRALMDPANDAYQAMLEEIVRHHYRYVMDTPAKLRQGEWFPFDEEPGELVARSSRISEPFVYEAVDDTVRPRGAFGLLEVGCGSGTYIRMPAHAIRTCGWSASNCRKRWQRARGRTSRRGGSRTARRSSTAMCARTAAPARSTW